MDVPIEPVIFNKFATTLSGHGASIVLPKVSGVVDYEAELVAVIGRGGMHIPRSQAPTRLGLDGRARWFGAQPAASRAGKAVSRV